MLRPWSGPALAVAGALLTVAVIGMTGRADDKKEQPKDELAKALATAHEHYVKREAASAASKKKEQYNEHQQMCKALAGVADHLHRVKPVEGEPKKYTKVTLNAHKKKFDAIIF